MALLFIDGFDHYVTAEIARKWSTSAGNAAISATGRRATSKSLSISSANDRVTLQLPAAEGTLCVGFAYYSTSAPSGHEGVEFAISGAAQCTVFFNANGSISVARGAYNGTVLGTSAIGLIKANTWQYVEFKAVIHDSTGTYEVKVNGVSVLSGTGADTKGQTTADADQLTIQGSGVAILIDDLYLDDADFLGDCRVDTLMPNGAGASSQWTPSAGSNFQNVDDAGDMDDDTTYNSDDTAGQIDTYTLPDIEATGGTIHAVAVNSAVRKDDAGARSTKNIVRQATTNYEGAAYSVTDSYLVKQDIWATQPDASGAWDETDLNAAEFGIKLEA